jgi:hypothetical protein
MHLLLPFFAFMHLHIASHLGTLDAPRGECDVGAESKDGARWIHFEDERTKQVLEPEMPSRRC